MPRGGGWPTVAAFLLERTHGAAEVRRRLDAGEVVLADGSAVTAETPYRGGDVVYLYRDLPEEVPPVPVSPELRHGVFLVVREALTNIVKHAHAACVRLRLRVEDETLHCRIEDDGHGFAPEAPAHVMVVLLPQPTSHRP